MPPFDARRVFEEVKANLAKLNGCSRHLFSGGAPKIGGKKQCRRCGGAMTLCDIAVYIRGYEASGSSAGDIWPEFHQSKSH